MAYRQETDRKSNQGFSLFTVIISIAFIGILAMLVIYFSMANFRMKVTDLKHKDDFYTAEQAMEEIRVGLQEDVGNAMAAAYTYVLENYSTAEEVTEATMDELRQSVFREEYVENLIKALGKDGADNQYDLSVLESYMDHKKELDSRELLQIVNPQGMAPVLQSDLKRGVLLKNLKVIYVDSTGVASIIQSDIRLSIPEVQFPTPSTLPDLMNMIVVADQGIICQGSNNGAVQTPSRIQGSVYAGLLNQKEKGKITETDPPGSTPASIRLEPNAVLEIGNGERLVCQGEIEIAGGGKLTGDSTVALWAQGISLASATLELQGKTYLADDLTVQKGNGSQVTISGEYYGYGSPESAKSEQSHHKEYFEGWTDKALSSAITINGKNTTLDLSGLSKIMLAGKNYIGTDRLPVSETAHANSDVMLGESLTVKGTQLAYLVPSQLLFDGNQRNPMTGEEYLNQIKEGTGFTEKQVISQENLQKPMEIWGGKSLLDLGVDKAMPVRTVFYNDNQAGGAVYFYLNFTDSASASAYMQNYYQNQVAREKMNEYLAFYFQSGGIRVNDPEVYLRCVTNGNVLSYDDSGSGLLNATSADQSASVQEQTGYQNMWYALNRKMISSYELLNAKVEDPNGTIKREGKDKNKTYHSEQEIERSVYDNLVNEAELLSYISKNENMTADNYQGYRFTASGEDGLTAVMLHNNGKILKYKVRKKTAQNDPPVYEEKEFPSKEKAFEITDKETEKLRLVVCTGDVIIKSGVKFQGIIMAGGTITLEPGAELSASPLEAARVFQAQMNDAEGLSPKDFFWEGDKYVLGNSASTEEGADTGYLSGIFDVADYVGYENWQKK